MNFYNLNNFEEIEFVTGGKPGEIVINLEDITTETDVISLKTWEINDIGAFISF